MREINYVTSGCSIIIHSKCLAGHTFQWESAVLINERQAKIHMDNLYFSAAIVLSRNHFHKIKLSDIFGLHITCHTLAFSESLQFPAMQEEYLYLDEDLFDSVTLELGREK